MLFFFPSPLPTPPRSTRWALRVTGLRRLPNSLAWDIVKGEIENTHRNTLTGTARKGSVVEIYNPELKIRPHL